MASSTPLGLRQIVDGYLAGGIDPAQHNFVPRGVDNIPGLSGQLQMEQVDDFTAMRTIALPRRPSTHESPA